MCTRAVESSRRESTIIHFAESPLDCVLFHLNVVGYQSIGPNRKAAANALADH